VWDYNDKQAYMDIGEDVRGPRLPAVFCVCVFRPGLRRHFEIAMVDAGAPPSRPLHSDAVMWELLRALSWVLHAGAWRGLDDVWDVVGCRKGALHSSSPLTHSITLPSHPHSLTLTAGGAQVRFRVAALRFPDEPTQASAQALDDPLGDGGAEDAPPPLGSADNPFAPMVIEVSRAAQRSRVWFTRSKQSTDLGGVSSCAGSHQ